MPGRPQRKQAQGPFCSWLAGHGWPREAERCSRRRQKQSQARCCGGAATTETHFLALSQIHQVLPLSTVRAQRHATLHRCCRKVTLPDHTGVHHTKIIHAYNGKTGIPDELSTGNPSRPLTSSSTTCFLVTRFLAFWHLRLMPPTYTHTHLNIDLKMDPSTANNPKLS